MKRFLFYFVISAFLIAGTSPLIANYSSDETVQTSSNSGGGSGIGTQAAVGALSYFVSRAVQKKSGGESSVPAAPPAVVTVVEFPVTAEEAQSAQAEVTVQKGNSVVTVNTPVSISQAPEKGSSTKCCKLTSLVIGNTWQHAVKVTVSGGGTQVIQPGRQVTFSGNLGECPRVKVQSAENLGEADANLVAEDVSLCCKDLKSGSYKKFFAISIVRFNYVELEKDCGGGENPPPPVTPKEEPPPTPHQPEEHPPVSHPAPEGGTTTTPGGGITTTPSHPPTHTPGENPPPKTPGTPPPPPVTDGGDKSECACCCHLVQQWMKGTPIKTKWGSPMNGSARVPLGKEFPLLINAIDMDVENISCQKIGVQCGSCGPCGGGGGEGQLIGDGGVPMSGGASGGGSAAGGSAVMIATGAPACKKPCESCNSVKFIPLASKVRFKWEIISGPGSLKSNPPYPHGHSAIGEGPAAVYVAPFALEPGESNTVTIKVTVDDMPYNADLDDDAVTETITLNLVGRKEQVAVTVLSPGQGYGSITSPDSKCDCKPITNWTTGSGITKDGDATADLKMCVDSYTVATAPAKDTDTLDMQCSGKSCSSPDKMDNNNDAVKYEWNPRGGNAYGALESAIIWSPLAPGVFTVQPTVKDSGIQYPDSPLVLPSVNVIAGKITIDTVAPPVAGSKKVSLGENVAIAYKIEPAGFQFEKLQLHVYNKNSVLVYKKDLTAGYGTPTAEWPGAKWNQEPHIGAYANPNNGPYEIVIVGSGPNCASASKYIDTSFTIQADIRDLKAGNASRASSLNTTIQYTRIKLLGPTATHDFFATDITRTDIPGLTGGNYGKRLVVDKPMTLGKLGDGKWTIRVYDNFDGVGNMLDTDPSTPGSDPYETDIELY